MKRDCPRRLSRRSPSAQQGFTLVEILASLVLIAASMLGLAVMLMKVQSNAYSAMLRTEASVILNDLAEKMVANRAGVIATPANYTYDASKRPSCANVGSITAVATLDIAQFECQAKSMLPKGATTVLMDAATNPTQATLTITWDDSRASGGAAAQSMNLVVRLQ